MKLKAKALVAALTMGAAVQANAAINDDGALANAAGGNGSGELFLSVIDRGGSNPQSYVRDLGLTANQFVNMDGSANNSVGTFNYAADSKLTSLLGNAATDGGTVKWDIAAAYNGDLVSVPFGFLTTSATTLNSSNTPLGFAGVAASLTKLGTYVKAVNQYDGSSVTDFAANNSDLVTSAASPAFYDGVNWGATWPNPTNTEAAIGSSMGFYYVGWDEAAGNNLGIDQTQISALSSVWTLDGSGNLTFGAAPAPVPLPPAVWLLGSALVGLVGVGRRRGSAVA